MLKKAAEETAALLEQVTADQKAADAQQVRLYSALLCSNITIMILLVYYSLTIIIL